MSLGEFSVESLVACIIKALTIRRYRSVCHKVWIKSPTFREVSMPLVERSSRCVHRKFVRQDSHRYRLNDRGLRSSIPIVVFIRKRSALLLHIVMPHTTFSYSPLVAATYSDCVVEGQAQTSHSQTCSQMKSDTHYCVRMLGNSCRSSLAGRWRLKFAVGMASSVFVRYGPQ